MVVDRGSNGDVEEGVSSALRLLFIESSIRPLDCLRNDRREEWEKQN